MTRKKALALFFVFTLAGLIGTIPVRGQGPSMRQRSSLNADWRFQKDDPPGSLGLLSYEKVKSWVTATGNEFVEPNMAKRPPAGNPGDRVPYTTRDFDDRGWRRLDLPHDWGVEGPFKQEYPGETGKLPWWGVGWYRKHFSVSIPPNTPPG